MAKKPKHKSDSTEPSGEAGDILDQFDNDLRELGNLEEDAEPGRGAARPSLGLHVDLEVLHGLQGLVVLYGRFLFALLGW